MGHSARSIGGSAREGHAASLVGHPALCQDTAKQGEANVRQRNRRASGSDNSNVSVPGVSAATSVGGRVEQPGSDPNAHGTAPKLERFCNAGTAPKREPNRDAGVGALRRYELIFLNGAADMTYIRPFCSRSCDFVNVGSVFATTRNLNVLPLML